MPSTSRGAPADRATKDRTSPACRPHGEREDPPPVGMMRQGGDLRKIGNSRQKGGFSNVTTAKPGRGTLSRSRLPLAAASCSTDIIIIPFDSPELSFVAARTAADPRWSAAGLRHDPFRRGWSRFATGPSPSRLRRQDRIGFAGSPWTVDTTWCGGSSRQQSEGGGWPTSIRTFRAIIGASRISLRFLRGQIAAGAVPAFSTDGRELAPPSSTVGDRAHGAESTAQEGASRVRDRLSQRGGGKLADSAGGGGHRDRHR